MYEEPIVRGRQPGATNEEKELGECRAIEVFTRHIHRPLLKLEICDYWFMYYNFSHSVSHILFELQLDLSVLHTSNVLWRINCTFPFKSYTLLCTVCLIVIVKKAFKSISLAKNFGNQQQIFTRKRCICNFCGYVSPTLWSYLQNIWYWMQVALVNSFVIHTRKLPFPQSLFNTVHSFHLIIVYL